MLVRFFTDLRAGGVPVTLPEFLSLLEGLEARLAALSPEDFYYLARMALVKDERHFDRFDRVFAEHFAGAEKLFEKLTAELPAEWLQALSERLFSEEEKSAVSRLSAAGTSCSRHSGNDCRNRRAGTRAAASGLAPRALRRSATGDSIPKESASARRGHARAARSRSGRRATTATSMTGSNSARATSRWPCAACGVSHAKAHPRSWISKAPSIRRRVTPESSISGSSPSGAMPSSCCCCSTWAARWIRT